MLHDGAETYPMKIGSSTFSKDSQTTRLIVSAVSRVMPPINHVTVTVKKYPDDVIEHPYPTVDKFIACSRPKYRVAGNTTTEANPLLS